MATTTMYKTLNKHWLGRISEQELIFCTIVAIVGLNAPQAYKIAYNKHNISPLTASSNASKIVNDANIQKALWMINEKLRNREIDFKESVLKSNHPDYSGCNDATNRDFNIRYRN